MEWKRSSSAPPPTAWPQSIVCSCGSTTARHVCSVETQQRAAQRDRLYQTGRRMKREYDHFVVLDLEATCDKNFNQDFGPQEVIEFSAVLLDARTQRIEDKFQMYVRPLIHPTLTGFCTKLTGITQSQVDEGHTLEHTLACFHNWLVKHGLVVLNNGAIGEDRSTCYTRHKFAFVTWTDWDLQTMLEQQCTACAIPKAPYYDCWINLKALYYECYRVRGHCNLQQAVERCKLKWEGREHSGIDDCVNTANVLNCLLNHGAVVTETTTFATSLQHQQQQQQQQQQHSPPMYHQQQHSPRQQQQQQQQQHQQQQQQHSPQQRRYFQMTHKPHHTFTYTTSALPTLGQWLNFSRPASVVAPSASAGGVATVPSPSQPMYTTTSNHHSNHHSNSHHHHHHHHPHNGYHGSHHHYHAGPYAPSVGFAPSVELPPLFAAV
eukprot:TRINITY_DN4446_c2_g1_i1.p1 TRINITY_DN4446_c2_g1~~TRINITY_DN4446_c2_g1_i1.p1  ORF type:complete len:434 (+),score=109.03 TRINITY_DN4446_c2_g1_i1:260-1561(+)